MRQWVVLFNKELLEMARNFKWIWVPIAFILLGVMDPLSTYYMPQIIKSAGGLPEGTVFEMPTPKTPDILMMSIGQFDMLGVLILVLITMGVISGERKSGVAEMILVKPVPFISYITAKWVGALLLIWVSFFVGFLASWYYIGILFDWIPFADFIQVFLLYGLWLTLVVTINIFFNTLFKLPGVVAFASLAAVIVLSLVSSTLAHLLEWSPALLSTYAGEFLVTQSFSEFTFPSVITTFIVILFLLAGAILIFRKKELAV